MGIMKATVAMDGVIIGVTMKDIAIDTKEEWSVGNAAVTEKWKETLKEVTNTVAKLHHANLTAL
jgi:hypothetical protein